MTDPNWLLATMAQSAAAMVAVIGGFLVSRIITLSVERQSLDRRSRELEEKTVEVETALCLARERRQAMSWDWFVDLAATACAQARGKIPDAELAGIYPIREVSESEMLAMACKLNEKMRAVFEQVASAENPLELDIPRRQEGIYQAAFIVLEVNWRPGSQGFSAFDRYDRLIGEENRLATDLAVLERERNFFEQELDRVTPPKGLGLGVGVLGYLTAVGVIAPVVALAMLPVPSTAASRLVLVALFVSGLAILFAYLIYAVRQLRWNRELPKRLDPSL